MIFLWGTLQICDYHYYYFKFLCLLNESSVCMRVCVCLYIHMYIQTYNYVHMYESDLMTICVV